MAMELFNGVAMKTRPCFYSGSGIDPHHRICVRGFNRIPSELKFCAKTLRRRVVGEICAFDDKGHMDYYNSYTVPVCREDKKKEKKKVGWLGVSEKKRAKLVKDLSKNLCMLSELGFGLESDQVKAKAISEAAVVLQEHLEHLKAEGKKLKKERAIAMNDSESSSSSSSESSDSECDNDGIVNMSVLRGKVAAERRETVPNPPISLVKLEEPCTKAEPKAIEEVGVVGLTVHNLEGKCTNGMDTGVQLKRVEICMGGKCKKMGAQVLMDEFRNVLGLEGSVVGCKCMGKCKTAPNVRVFNGVAIGDGLDDADDSVRSPTNPLYLGVGLEDVGLIVANYLGSEQSRVC